MLGRVKHVPATRDALTTCGQRVSGGGTKTTNHKHIKCMELVLEGLRHAASMPTGLWIFGQPVFLCAHYGSFRSKTCHTEAHFFLCFLGRYGRTLV